MSLSSPLTTSRSRRHSISANEAALYSLTQNLPLAVSLGSSGAAAAARKPPRVHLDPSNRTLFALSWGMNVGFFLSVPLSFWLAQRWLLFPVNIPTWTSVVHELFGFAGLVLILLAVKYLSWKRWYIRGVYVVAAILWIVLSAWAFQSFDESVGVTTIPLSSVP